MRVVTAYFECSPMLTKLLIANRGEIACRIQRTARRLGIGTVAVYSQADRDALHVRLADEALAIGPPPPQESYLNIEAVLAAAQRAGADAVHPGYGFLSENAEFAARCRSAGLVFVGPPAGAIATMGSKSAAKQAMLDAGVPVLPGYHGRDQSVETLAQEAAAVGYPVLLKAVAGGGGKGMRIVETAAELAEALAAASREARASFGDATMLVEKYLSSPRHIEVQVFFDQHGNGVYLFERDCSLQRRHQKVVEEAPAPGLSPELRAALGTAAVRAGAAVDYEGAGTVEFLLDDDGSFYFMEMNTRLQVEHPVTECVTGTDLVEWQLKVAMGERLPMAQAELALRGHAIEARLYAEDADAGFLPQSGRLTELRLPVGADGVRVDTGVESGDEISIYYDPMIAKVIAWAESRNAAITRLASALGDIHTAGVTTNDRLLYALVVHPAFRNAELHTGFIARHADALFAQTNAAADRWFYLGAMARALLEHADTRATSGGDAWSPWLAADGFRVNQQGLCTESLRVGERTATIVMAIAAQTDGRWRFDLERGNGRQVAFARLDGEQLDVETGGVRSLIQLARRPNGVRLYATDGAADVVFNEPTVESLAGPERVAAALAPMSGTVIAIHVAAGDSVAAGDTLLVVEAMKMEHPLKAAHPTQIAAIHCAVGDQVAGEQVLVEYATDAATD